MTTLKLRSIKECLQDRRLQWFGHLERTEETAWSSNLEPSMLAVVHLEHNQRKHGIR